MTWSLGKSAAEGRSAVEGFHVYRWQNPISETACPGCPRVYERIADVGVESGTAVGDRRLDFSHEVRLPRGYRYAFKVIAYTRDRLVSGDSNILDFEY